MGKLIYSMLTSLDGYVSGPDGSIDWAGADEGLHIFIAEQMASVGTFLNGRRMYETMVYWETAHLEQGQPEFVLDFARMWQAACPAIVGGGHRFFPDDVRVDLKLLDERQFGNGVVYLRYVASGGLSDDQPADSVGATPAGAPSP